MTLSSSYGLKPHQAGEYSKSLSKSYGWLHGLAQVCRGFLFDTTDLLLSRKIWLVSEMIDQEVVEQSAVTKQAPDNIPVKECIILFPKTLFQVIRGENNQLRRSDAKRLMPPQIKYEVLTPTKRNEKKPKRNSSEFKSKRKLTLDDADEDDNDNSDSDDEQNVEDEDFKVTILETSVTRSGRQVKQRVIQGTKESQKQNKKSKPAEKKSADEKASESTDDSDLENDAEMNELIAVAKRKKNNQNATSNSNVTNSKQQQSKSPVSKRQPAKKAESPPKKTAPKSPAKLALKNKSKKIETAARASPRGQKSQEKSTTKRANSRTRLDSPMAKISIDDEKENKRSSPRKRNRDSSSGSQSSSSQSSQKSSPQPKKGLKSGKQTKVANVETTITKTRSGRTSKRAKT